MMQLNKSLATNNVLSSAGIITYGGILSLTNLSATLTTNDSFKLFNASTYTGVFTNITPASPGVGLAWNTNTLASNGTLSISAVALSQPEISSILNFGASVVVSGSNGVPNTAYRVLSSTNLALPTSSWTIKATNMFDINGGFIFTNPVDPAVPMSFYMLQFAMSCQRSAHERHLFPEGNNPRVVWCRVGSR